MADNHLLTNEDRNENETTNTNKNEQMTNVVHENGYESECSSSSRSEADMTRSVLEIEADAFTRFIEQQRVQVMFELRNLRMGERPVTGQSNRGQIETFLNNIRRQSENTRTPSTRPVVPGAHIADIDALASRRCVSAALGSTAFRQDLEHAIRRSIETRPTSTVREVPRATPSPQQLTSDMIEQSTTQITEIRSSSPLQATPIVREQQNRPMNEPLNIERQENEINAWQAITQLQRETIVLEISDLVHRQLVTSALESDFRRHLEQNVLNHLQHGAPTDEQTELQTPIVAPAPRIPPVVIPNRPTTNNYASRSTIDELSSRIDSMQHMLQVMFTMQIDMQRSIRQEVASAISNNSSTINSLSTQPMNAGHCTVCLTALADTVLYRCGHLCVCYMCGLNLRQSGSTTRVKCPICRAPVDDILRVYRSSRDGE